MATFPNYKPVYAATKRSNPKVGSTQLGDGYKHKVTFGLNQNPKTWELTFNLTESQADEVEAFLDARALDAEAFGWVPPGETTQFRWRCESWTRELFDYDRSKITATFVQKFEPDVSVLLPVIVPNLLVSRGAITLANNTGRGSATVDSSGNSYHAMIYGTASAFYYQVVVTKRSPSGAALWSKSYGTGPYFQSDHSPKIVMAPNGGSVYVLYRSVIGIPIYVYKIRNDGVLEWCKIITTNDDLYNDFQYVQFIAVSPVTEDVIIGSMTSNTRARIIALSKNGDFEENKIFVSSGAFQFGPQFCFDSSGNIFAAARYYGVGANSGRYEIRIVKLNSSYEFISSITIGGSGEDIANISDTSQMIAFDGTRLVITDLYTRKMYFLNSSTLTVEQTYLVPNSIGEIAEIVADGGYIYARHDGGGNVLGYVSKINPSGVVVACKRVTKIPEVPDQGIYVGSIRGMGKMLAKDYFAFTLNDNYTTTPPGVYAAVAFGINPGTFTVSIDSFGPSIKIDDVSFTLSTTTSPPQFAGPTILDGNTEFPAPLPTVSVTDVSVTPVDVGTTIGWIKTATESTFMP